MTDKTIFIFDAQEGDKLADDVHTVSYTHLTLPTNSLV